MLLLQEDVREMVYMHRRLLTKAFDLLSSYVRPDWVVSAERWHQVVKLVYPDMTEVKISLMLYVLDDNHNDMLSEQCAHLVDYSARFIQPSLKKILVRSLEEILGG